MANLESDVDTERLRNLHGDSGPDISLEARNGSGKFIGTHRQLRDGVIARGCGGHGKHRAGVHILGFDGGSRNDGPRLICNSAGNRAAVALRECSGREDEG